MKKNKLKMQRKIIHLYFHTHLSIRTIAGIYNMNKSDIGKIIQRYKKFYDIR